MRKATVSATVNRCICYEVVEFVGRWSMIDVFVVPYSLRCGVRMGGLMNLSCDGCVDVCFSRHNDNVFCDDL